ncbi:MAG: hypothetical protein ACQES9_04120 [Myxococcota bacterium]
MQHLKLLTVFILLWFLVGATGCKEKTDQKNDEFSDFLKQDLQSLSETQPQKNRKKRINEKKSKKNKAAKVDNTLEKIGKCILESVKFFRESLAAKKIPNSKKLQEINNRCRNNLYSFVKNYNYINKHYQIYCLLAADYLDEMQLGIKKIKNSIQFSQLKDLEKLLVEKYNKFALKNNDLAGIDILDKTKEYKKTRLAKRTFRDEIARSGKKIGNLLFKWQQKHNPSSDNQDEPGEKYPTRTRVYFNFLKNTWEDEKKYLDSISCTNKFSNTDKKNNQTEKPEKTGKNNDYNCKTLTDQLNTFRQHCEKLISLWEIQLKHVKKPSSIQKNKKKLKEEFKNFSNFYQTLPQPL